MVLSGHPFEVVQVMVDPAAQREGIGRVILRRLVVKATRAWLVTLPDPPCIVGLRGVRVAAAATSLSSLGTRGRDLDPGDLRAERSVGTSVCSPQM